MNKKSPPHCS